MDAQHVDIEKEFPSVMKYKDWDFLIAQCDETTHFSDEQKADFRKALITLRRILGEHFWKGAFKSRHPIVGKVLDQGLIAKSWLLWLSRALEAFEKLPNFNKEIRRKLRDKGTFERIAFALYVGEMFLQSGFSVDVEPIINGFTSVPDLRLTNHENGEVIFVEIKDLEPSRLEREANSTFYPVVMAVMREVGGLLYVGSVHRMILESEMKVVEDITEFVRRTRAHNYAFDELHVDGMLDLAVASEAGRPMLQLFATALGREVNEFGGNFPDADEFARVRRKIAEAQSQLPTNQENVIVIRSDGLRLRDDTLKETVVGLQEMICQYPHVFLVVLMCPFHGRDMNPLTVGPSVVEKRPLLFTAEARTLIMNDSCGKLTSQLTKGRVVDVFRFP